MTAAPFDAGGALRLAHERCRDRWENDNSDDHFCAGACDDCLTDALRAAYEAGLKDQRAAWGTEEARAAVFGRMKYAEGRRDGIEEAARLVERSGGVEPVLLVIDIRQLAEGKGGT
jgi:hypothetical protein